METQRHKDAHKGATIQLSHTHTYTQEFSLIPFITASLQPLSSPSAILFSHHCQRRLYPCESKDIAWL